MNTPWKIDEGFIINCNGGLIGLVDEMGGLEIARRIVACVNACKNISDNDLEGLITFGGLTLDRLNVLTAQRDELLAALKALTEVLGPDLPVDMVKAEYDKSCELVKKYDHA